MLSADKAQKFEALMLATSREEWLWMSGFLAAKASDATMEVPPATQTSAPPSTIAVVYATETGNSKKVATQFTARLKQQQLRCKLLDANVYNPSDLQKETQLILVISTQGEGEPPVTAQKLFNWLRTSPTLTHLKVGIVALGSSSYPLFCQAGTDAAELFKNCGAKQLLPPAFCDDDYEPVANAWLESVLSVLQVQPSSRPAIAAPKPAGKKAFVATLGSKHDLSDGGKRKVLHLEFDLNEELVYTPGNAVGFTPHNPPELVHDILKLLHTDATSLLQFKTTEYSAEKLFGKVVSLTNLSTSVVNKYAQLTGHDIPSVRMDLADLLRIYPWPQDLAVQQLCDLLNPISPRLYTLSSSPAAHTGQLHLTVALETFNHNNRNRFGLASSCIQELAPGSRVNFFLHQQKHFQLPRHDRHLIMIGEGTGIAPFRSMLYERDATNARGQNLLLFAEDDYTKDFFYQSELQALHATGTLSKLQVSFAKNAPTPLSLEQLIMEHASTISGWMEVGAFLLISGRKAVLNPIVEETLCKAVEHQQNITQEEALAKMKTWSKEGRIATELY